MYKYIPDSRVDGINMGPTRDMLVPDRPHVGPMNLAISDSHSVNGSHWHASMYHHNVGCRVGQLWCNALEQLCAWSCYNFKSQPVNIAWAMKLYTVLRHNGLIFAWDGFVLWQVIWNDVLLYLASCSFSEKICMKQYMNILQHMIRRKINARNSQWH